MIRYKYAKNKNGDLVDISSLNDGNSQKQSFFCIGCGKELVAKLGKINAHHFAHKNIVTCSGETYLHLLGKKRFFDKYTMCLKEKKPFIIELYESRTCNHYKKEIGITCKWKPNTVKFDLTQFFDKISIEKREGEFIPDIMLTSKNEKDKLFVEIAVTHKCTDEKTNSNYRIIEIQIENENDLLPINMGYLSVNDSKVKLINFKKREKEDSICGGNCQKKYNLFILDKNGNCNLYEKTPKQIKNHLSLEKDTILKHEISNGLGRSYSELFRKSIANFSEQGFKIKNCFICRYHAENKYNYYGLDIKEYHIFCRFLKGICDSNAAMECQYFKLEKKYLNPQTINQ